MSKEMRAYKKNVASSHAAFPKTVSAHAASFAKEMFVTDEMDIERLKASFSDMMDFYPKFCFEPVDKRRATEGTVWPIQVLDYSHWVSKLFWGQDLKGEKLTYKMVESLLADGPEIERCRERRQLYKMAFLEGADSKYLQLPQGSWVVFRDIPLPFVIMVDMLWFNSKSVTPDIATVSEMQQAGRIVNANKTLYEKGRYCAPLLASLIQLEQNVVYDYEPGSTERLHKTLFSDWFTPEKFVWYVPMHETVVTDIPNIGRATFLAIPRKLVESNLDKIVLRKGAILGSFAGELKVHNIYEKEQYAITYIAKHKTDTQIKDDTTYLIYTTNESEKRMGLSSIPFYSNHTCANEWFVATVNNLSNFKLVVDDTELVQEKITGNIVLGANEFYRQRSLMMQIDVTGAMFKARHDALFANPEAKAWKLLEMDMDMMYVPLEWEYFKVEPAEDDESRNCMCLTHCYFRDRSERSRGPFEDGDLRPRPPPTAWNMDKVKAAGFSKQDSIQLYLEQFPTM